MKRLLAAMVLAAATPALAEVSEIRIGKQYGIGYLPIAVMEHQDLLEREAKAQGLDLRAGWVQMANPLALNDLMFAGKLEVAVGSVPAFLTLWSKTRGNASVEIKGISAMVSYPQLMNTNKAHIRSLKDFTETDRIAMGGIKVTAAAIILQIAAEQVFGPGNAFRLDPLTVQLAHPDGMAALLTGRTEITAHLTAPPYQYLELRDPRIHTVLNSDDVLGGPATAIMAWTTARFRADNPRSYRALLSALGAAVDLINRDKRRAAEIYLEVSKERATVAEIEAMLNRPEVRYTLVPENVMPFAEFMHRTKTIPVRPAGWQDLFLSDIHHLSGS